MAEAKIPVDLFNPGQVFACLGFLEAAEILLGDAAGGFEWEDWEATFRLCANGSQKPVEAVLEFLAEASPRRWAPLGYSDPPPKKGAAEEDDDADEEGDDSGAGSGASSAEVLERSAVFPARSGDRMALPIKMGGGNRPLVELGHWTDGSGRNEFKLYSGNRSADRIARAMLMGVRKKPTKRQRDRDEPGDLKFKGVAQLWADKRELLLQAPFDVLTPMGGSFNFDPRGAWTAIDAGYSPNEHKHAVEASPVVEFLAAWGLENARPDEFDTRQVRYRAWNGLLPPILARAALAGAIPTVDSRRFQFQLDLSGKNKVVTFAQEEPRA